MNDERKETTLKFQNKPEIVNAIQILTPFTRAGNTSLKQGEFQFAEDKIKELIKLL